MVNSGVEELQKYKEMIENLPAKKIIEVTRIITTKSSSTTNTKHVFESDKYRNKSSVF